MDRGRQGGRQAGRGDTCMHLLAVPFLTPRSWQSAPSVHRHQSNACQASASAEYAGVSACSGGCEGGREGGRGRGREEWLVIDWQPVVPMGLCCMPHIIVHITDSSL